jgi:hypothetical protein
MTIALPRSSHKSRQNVAWIFYGVSLFVSQINTTTGLSVPPSLLPVANHHSYCCGSHDCPHTRYAIACNRCRTSLHEEMNSQEEPFVSRLSMEGLTLERFKRRRESLKRKVLQDQWQRPPNPLLSPTDLVRCLLETLRQLSSLSSTATATSTPLSSSTSSFVGVTTLLESSTPKWRQTLLSSIGAPLTARNEQVAPTLEAALGRRNNQFAILLGTENPNYQMDFPTDPVDYGDGTCWVECRLRDEEASTTAATATTTTTTTNSNNQKNKNDELLVVTGWSLEQRPSDGAWMVAALDWQDFRPPYRPGIGREEWERICG